MGYIAIPIYSCMGYIEQLYLHTSHRAILNSYTYILHTAVWAILNSYTYILHTAVWAILNSYTYILHTAILNSFPACQTSISPPPPPLLPSDHPASEYGDI